jgi:hypothetical protein
MDEQRLIVNVALYLGHALPFVNARIQMVCLNHVLVRVFVGKAKPAGKRVDERSETISCKWNMTFSSRTSSWLGTVEDAVADVLVLIVSGFFRLVLACKDSLESDDDKGGVVHVHRDPVSIVLQHTQDMHQ